MRLGSFFPDCTDIIWRLQSGLLRNNPGWKIFHVFSNAISDFLANKARAERWTWNCHNAIPLLPSEVFGSVTHICLTCFIRISVRIMVVKIAF